MLQKYFLIVEKGENHMSSGTIEACLNSPLSQQFSPSGEQSEHRKLAHDV